MLTRPRAQQAAWLHALQLEGVAVRGWPLIDIAPPDDPRALTQAWQRLPSARLAFFASPNAVDAVMQARPAGVAWPASCWAACVGPGSADALLAAGVPPARVLTPPADAAQFDSEALWPLLSGVEDDWRGHLVLLLRGQGGREWLGDRLRAAGAQVLALSVYRRQSPQPSAAERAELQAWMLEQPPPLWLLSSSEAIAHWQALVGGALPALPVLATHPRIADAARQAGLRVTEVLPTVPAVAAAWRAHAGQHRRAADPAP